MFGPEAGLRPKHSGLSNAALSLFDRLVSVVAACQADGFVAEGLARDHALFSWAVVHGTASLLVEHQLEELEPADRSMEALAELVLSRALAGIGRRSA
jgi:hypothetical protein